MTVRLLLTNKHKMKHLLILLFSIASLSSHASYWYVNSSEAPDSDFTTLQDAINSNMVSKGDTLYVAKSTMYESTVLNKALTIIGPGYNLRDTTNGETLSLAALVWNLKVTSKANGAVIEGLSIVNSLTLQNVENIKIIKCKIKHIKTSEQKICKHATITSCYIFGSLKANISESYVYKNSIILPTDETISLGSNCMINENIILGNAESPLLETTNSSITKNTIINTAACKENAAEIGYKFKNINIQKNGEIDNQVYNNVFSAIAGVPNHTDRLNIYITPDKKKDKKKKLMNQSKEQELFNALNSLYDILQLPNNY